MNQFRQEVSKPDFFAQDGFTPLAVALQLCHDAVVSLLLERDSGGKGRLPALHVAAKKDDVHAVSLLLANNDINVNHASTVSSQPFLADLLK